MNKWQDTANADTSEISNDTSDYKQLMIIGNKSGDGKTRATGVWDRLNVHGNLFVDNDTKTNSIGRNGTDDWFRIFGTNAGTAVYNGMSINDNGGLAIGTWNHAPQGQLWVDTICNAAGGNCVNFNDIIRNGQKMGIKSSRGGYLSDQGGWKGKPGDNGNWEVMYIDKLNF